jgi:hypothetical protein
MNKPNEMAIARALMVLAELDEQERVANERRARNQHKPMFPEWETFSWSEEPIEQDF